MTTMRHPFQVLCAATPTENRSKEYMFAACGPSIFSVDVVEGTIVSSWSSEQAKDNNIDKTNGENDQPLKKRKLDQAISTASVVIKLTITPDQSHLVAVTGEDKCIRVFGISDDGKLLERSQRCMPKRPCAILVTPDSQTILCGDKFGDVYALPLIPGEYAPPVVTTPAVSERAYNPTASSLTVHTARNRKALEEQMKLKGATSVVKEPLKFEHQLLLGHVSMLTDMQYATVKVENKARHHIITSDRDEHIRVSRGPSQAHIIERYCMGHVEFISFLRVLSKSNLLVSGGGDDWLGVWDWTTGELLAKQSLRKHLESNLESKDANIAVSGIWVVANGHNGKDDVVCVAVEGVHAVLVFDSKTLKDDSSPVSVIPIKGGQVLDLVGTSNGHVVLSVDAMDGDVSRLQEYKVTVEGSAISLVSTGVDRLNQVNAAEVPLPDRKALDTMLYGVEKLRKRGEDDGNEAD